MAVIIGELWTVQPPEDYWIWFCHTIWWMTAWPSLLHDGCQFTFDRYLSSLFHEQRYGRYLSIVDCVDHGRAMADITGELWIVWSLEHYLIWFCHTILTDGTGTDDGWQMTIAPPWWMPIHIWQISVITLPWDELWQISVNCGLRWSWWSDGGYYWWVVNCAVTRRLFNLILPHNFWRLAQGQMMDDRWQMTDRGW